jgi:tRNA(Arg) A34 adenosine deaminase TadA
MIEPLTIALPDWTGHLVDPSHAFRSVEERMQLAIALARENVLRGSGGPFGAAVFELETGRLVGVGVNLVVGHHNSVLHAEILALMTAEQVVGSYSLRADGLPEHELVASCSPCAMCLGEALWGGVRRITTGATREEAMAFGFDEGPVFPESYRYLERRGVAFRAEVLREEAKAVLALYRDQGGMVYNG